MGYIVNLTVILYNVFRTAAGRVSVDGAQAAMNSRKISGRRDRIHRDIKSFVLETFEKFTTVTQRDLALEKIVDLIRQYCAGVRIAQAVGSKTSTTTAPVHHPNANSFISASCPHMLDPFPLVSLVEPLLDLT